MKEKWKEETEHERKGEKHPETNFWLRSWLYATGWEGSQ